MIVQYVRADRVPEGARVLYREFPAVFRTVAKREPGLPGWTRLWFKGVDTACGYLSSELLRCDLSIAADAVASSSPPPRPSSPRSSLPAD